MARDRRRPGRSRLAWLPCVGALTAAFCLGLDTHGSSADPFDLAERRAAYRRPIDVPFPAHNAWSAEREALGRTLFFDPRLSRSGVMSCATCHNPALGWADGLPRGIGHGMQTLARRTPTIVNLAWGELFFWDGRADSLEAQALGPITSKEEMNLPLDELLARLRGIAEYGPLFARAYPGEGITAETIAKAIATFERTVVSAPAPFDRWVAGEEDAISESARRGFVVFETRARCAECHGGWRFTDDSFHDIGVASDDPGRSRVLPGIDVLEHAFKTPTLRNVERRAPYMHDGSERTLEDVIELYVRGGRAKRPSLSDQLRPVELTDAERRDLVAFLRTLTSEDPIPASPRMPL